MNQTIRTFALVAAGLLAAALFLFALSLALGMALLGVIALFLFALSLALGMALLGVIALFAAWAASPEDTKAFLKTARGMVNGWVAAMVKMVEDAGGLMREVLSRWGGKPAAEPQTAQAPAKAEVVESGDEAAPAKEPKA